MTRSEATKKVRSLVDRVLEKHGSSAWMSVISEKGKVDFVAVNRIEGGSISAAKKEIRAWAKKYKVKLQWTNIPAPQRRNPKKKKTVRPSKKQRQIPPPFKKLTKSKINKLKGLFRVHRENPDPGDCPNCGMAYDALKTGLNFQAVKDMLWVQDDNPEYWRNKRRGSVLGLWYEIKRGMWADHIEMCGGKPMSEAEYLDVLAATEDY